MGCVLSVLAHTYVQHTYVQHTYVQHTGLWDGFPPTTSNNLYIPGNLRGSEAANW